MHQIGRYKISGELGRGAMGIVYRALDPAIGRTVAIKTIRLSEFVDVGERSKLRDRLFREAQSAGILSHPGIVTIYDIGEEGDVAYIAMECVEGPTLDRLIASQPPDGRLVLSLLAQTAAALDYAHKRGIVHRDIKPANIIVHDLQHSKITDFGVAKVQSHQMTQAGLMIGTPNYMSPEQIQGKQVEGSSDQYSLAVIAYELLAGEKPFAADSIPALAYKIANEEPAPIQHLNPTLNWAVDTVVRRALSKKPEERYPTCSEFAAALENACRSCKDWRPLPPGASHDAATVVEGKPARGAAVPVAARAAVAEKPQVSIPPVQHRAAVPFPLRLVRLVALVVVGAGIVSALLIGALRYLEGTPEPVAQNVETPAEPQGPRPSAMGEPVARTLPGDRDESPPASEEADETPAPSVPEPQPPAPNVPATRALTAVQEIETRLVTNPPGAFVVVDGLSQYSCKSPCTMTLPPGRHTVSASMGGYRRTLKIFELPQDTENFLNLEPTTGTVALRTEPQGAVIVVDGKQRNERTPAILTLPTGRHTIELVLNGHRERHEVEVRDSVITNVAVDFPGR